MYMPHATPQLSISMKQSPSTSVNFAINNVLLPQPKPKSKEILPVPFPSSIPSTCQKCPFLSPHIKCQHLNRTFPDLSSYLLRQSTLTNFLVCMRQAEVAGNLIWPSWQTLYCLLINSSTLVGLQKTLHPVRIILHLFVRAKFRLLHSQRTC